MLVTIDWMNKNYKKYNDLYFNGVLPNIDMKISRSRKTWGYAAYTFNRVRNTVKPTSITLSNYYDSPEEVKLTTLLHEMIHIYDYTINPRHFIANGRKVKYDAHGFWFKSECERLKPFGWDIEKYVTAEEKSVSTLSAKSAAAEARHRDEALVCVVVGSNGYNWLFKTNTWRVEEALNTVARYSWTYTCGTVKDINIYHFNDPALAMVRSAGKKIRGWRYSHAALLSKLEQIKATETHDYASKASAVVAKLAA